MKNTMHFIRYVSDLALMILSPDYIKKNTQTEITAHYQLLS